MRDGLGTAAESVGGVHSYCANAMLAYVLLDFYDELTTVGAENLHRIVDCRKDYFFLPLGLEAYVYNRADDLYHSALD